MQQEAGLKTYLDEIGRNRVLTREEEADLFERIEQGEEQARETVVHCNLKFVIRIAGQFRGRGLPFDDLIQEGNIGLLEAVGKFDFRRGFRFSTYAAFWIRQAIQVAVRQRGSLIRLPMRKSRMLGFMTEIIQEYWAVEGRPPTEEELAERLEISPDQARELSTIGDAVLSLDMPIDEDGAPLMDVVPDTRSLPVEHRMLEEEQRDRLSEAMHCLSARESRVLRQRYGFTGGKGRSLRKISSGMGLSQEGVRRIEQRALNKLRRPHVRRTIAGLL